VRLRVQPLAQALEFIWIKTLAYALRATAPWSTRFCVGGSFMLSPHVPPVGQPAPDFDLPAYHEGAEIRVRLSACRGYWVVLLFYSSDFSTV